jgi:hypothetical protein
MEAGSLKLLPKMTINGDGHLRRDGPGPCFRASPVRD